MSSQRLWAAAVALALHSAFSAVTAAQSPQQLAISSATPDVVAGTVALSGANFTDRSDPEPRVWINRVPVAIQSATATQVVVGLPAGLAAGSYLVEMTRTNGQGNDNRASTNGPRYGAITLTIGAVGATGPQGPQGQQGVQGPAGPAGAKGDTGSAGPKGETGVEGPAGPEGPRGPQGLQGTPGDTGPQGPAGPAGMSGYEVVERVLTIRPLVTGDNGQVDIYCPAGKLAVGAGHLITTVEVIATEARALPMGTGHGWHFYTTNLDLFDKIVIYRVVCVGVS